MAKHKSYPGGAAINAPWTAQKLRNRLVKNLGVTKEEVASITDQYRFVSGFVDLRRLGLPIIYVYFSTDRMAHDNSPDGYVRTATSLKDYTGGQNWWTTWKAAEHQILKTARMGESVARPMRERPTEAQEAASLKTIEDWGKTVANPGGNSELDSLVRELKTASPNRRKMILVQLGEMFAAIYESRYPDETPATRKDNTVAFRPRRNPSPSREYWWAIIVRDDGTAIAHRYADKDTMTRYSKRHAQAFVDNSKVLIRAKEPMTEAKLKEGFRTAYPKIALEV